VSLAQKVKTNRFTQLLFERAFFAGITSLRNSAEDTFSSSFIYTLRGVIFYDLLADSYSLAYGDIETT
jgi:hypothetical protein